MTSFPDVRLRRVRELEAVRSLTRETRLAASNFIYPLFVTHGQGIRQPIEPMPGCFHLSLDMLAEEVAEVVELGLPGVLLFGLPAEKDPVGSGAYDPEGIIQEAIRVIKQAAPDLLVIGDVCLCEYTDHGHCGVIVNDGAGKGRIDNDQTLELLARTALAQVQAGGRYGSALGDDGRPGAGHPGHSERLRLSADADNGLCRQVRLGLLRPPSGWPPTPRPSSATGAAIRWIRPTVGWRCGRLRATSPKAPTS